MKKIKEINLSVGASQPNFPGTQTRVFNGYSGGMLTNADSFISRRMQNVSNKNDVVDEDEDEDDIIEKDNPMKDNNILKQRVHKEGKYCLQETLNNITVDAEINEITSATDAAADAYSLTRKSKIANAIAKNTLGKTGLGKKIIKSAIGGIPIVDVIYGTYRLASVAITIREFGDQMSNLLDKEPGYFGQALIENDGSHWNNLIKRVIYHAAKDPEMQKVLKDTFNNLLENIKDFIITLIEAYDTPVEAAAGAPVAGIGAVFTTAVGNATTFLLGLGARTAPIERVLFSGVGQIAKGISAIIEFVFGKGDKTKTNKLQDQIVNLEEKGGSVLFGILRSPVDTLDRLHDLYKVLDEDAKEYIKTFKTHVKDKSSFSDNSGLENLSKPTVIAAAPKLTEIHKYPILFLLEGVIDEEEVDEEDSFEEIDLEEFSGAGAAGGYALPLGASNKSPSKQKDHHKILEKQMNEQIERMRILEAYHQKTTNKLK